MLYNGQIFLFDLSSWIVKQNKGQDTLKKLYFSKLKVVFMIVDVLTSHLNVR